MTIRGGGSPRGNDSATDQAYPIEDEDWTPAAQGTYRDVRRSRGRNGGGGGLSGLIRFLVFALVMASIVMVAMLTVLRPIWPARSSTGRTTARVPSPCRSSRTS